MTALVRIGEAALSDVGQIRVPFVVEGSWGRHSIDALDLTATGFTLAQAVAAIKARVIAWAGSAAGGSVTLRSSDIWLSGLGDEQISGVRKSADQATSSASFVDCDDLSFTLAPNSHYKFKFVGAYTSAAATTGLQLSVTGPASPAYISFVGQTAVSAIAAQYGAGGAYDAPLAANASGGATPLPFTVEGTISTGAQGGLFKLRARSEVGGSTVTILRGSFGELVAV